MQIDSDETIENYKEGLKRAVSKDTIDEDVMRVLRMKAKTQDDLIQAVKARIGGGHDGV